MVHLTNAKLQWGSSESPCDVHVTTQEIHSDSSFCKTTLRQKETLELSLLCILNLSSKQCAQALIPGKVSSQCIIPAEQSSWWGRQAKPALQLLSLVKGLPQRTKLWPCWQLEPAPIAYVSMAGRGGHRTWSPVDGKGWLFRNNSAVSTHTLYSLNSRIK